MGRKRKYTRCGPPSKAGLLITEGAMRHFRGTMKVFFQQPRAPVPVVNRRIERR